MENGILFLRVEDILQFPTLRITLTYLDYRHLCPTVSVTLTVHTSIIRFYNWHPLRLDWIESVSERKTHYLIILICIILWNRSIVCTISIKILKHWKNIVFVVCFIMLFWHCDRWYRKKERRNFNNDLNWMTIAMVHWLLDVCSPINIFIIPVLQLRFGQTLPST